MTVSETDETSSDTDVEARREAMLRLSDWAGPATTGVLLRGLGDPDWRVRQEAIRAGKRLLERLDLGESLVAAVSQGDNVGLRNAALELTVHMGAAAVPHLVAALPSADESARRFLVEALACGGDPRAIEALVGALHNPDPNVVAAASDALARIGGPEAEAALLDQLAAADSYTRMTALDGLNRMRARVPPSRLLGLLSDRLLRRVAVEALGRSADVSAVGPLAEMLGDRSPRVVVAAARALFGLWVAGVGDDEVLHACRSLDEAARSGLAQAATSGDVGEATAATALLVMARAPAALRTVAALCQRTGSVDESLLRTLLVRGDEAIVGLIEDVRTGSDATRAVALELACHLGHGASPEVAVRIRETLRLGLHDPDDALRRVALEAMGHWAEAEDAGLLAGLAVTRDPDLSESCARALRTLGEKHPLAVREALGRVNLEAFSQPALATLLVMLGGDYAVSRLQQALVFHDEQVRAAAVEALSAFGTDAAAELIVLSLTDESEEVQVVAARALGEIAERTDRPVGVESLLLALENATPPVQAAAARALGQSRDPAAFDALREKLRRAQPLVQLAAVEAIRRFADPAVGDLLVEVLGYTDPEAVKEALQGIREIGHPRATSRIALALDHPSWDVRRAAATLLGEMDAAAAPFLRARIAVEADEQVRAAMGDALRQLGEDS